MPYRPTYAVAGELGIVFFLFEMGLELSIARLNAMKKDVFGLGTMQFLLTSAAGSCLFWEYLNQPETPCRNTVYSAPIELF